MRSNRNKSTINKPISLVNAAAEQNRIAKEVDLDAISDDIYKGNKIVIVDDKDPYNGKEEYEIRYILRKLYPAFRTPMHHFSGIRIFEAFFCKKRAYFI